MKLLRKIDEQFDRAAELLFGQKHRRAAKMLLYLLAGAIVLGIPHALIRHVSTSGFYLVSVEREARVGEKAAAYLIDELKLRRQDPVSRYVEEVGLRISHENNPWQADFSFSVIEDDRMVNAFAIPGGRIYITTGMLKKLDNEAELASVLAHEVAHVTRRHYARNLGRHMLLSWVKKFLGSTDRAILDTGSFLTTNVTLLQMRQEDELEADHQGALYMYELDYDPEGVVSLIRKLLSLEKQMPEYMRVMAVTHPPSRERLDAMINLRESLPEKDGLTLGEEQYRRVMKTLEAPGVIPAQ